MSDQARLTDQPALAGVSSNGAEIAAPNARVSVRDLVDGQPVAATFVVRERDRRSTRKGDDYLRLTLGDRTGSIPAVVWDEVEDAYALAEPGTIAHVAGRFSVHDQYGPQIKVDSIRIASPEEAVGEDLLGGPDL